MSVLYAYSMHFIYGLILLWILKFYVDLISFGVFVALLTSQLKTSQNGQKWGLEGKSEATRASW